MAKKKVKPSVTEDTFEQIVQGRKSFNNKPIWHWEAEAEELVVELILRAAFQHTDNTSLIGYIARKRLLSIAVTENPTLFMKVLSSRDRCFRGFDNILKSIING